MSDGELRDLERRCRAPHATAQDEAAHLVERLRAGTLTRERLALAAACGDEAARLAGGVAPPERADDPLLAHLDAAARRDLDARFARPLRWWAVGLRRWGPQVWALAVSTALEVSGELMVEAEEPRLAAGTALLADVRAAIEVWGACPCEAHAQTVRMRSSAPAERTPATAAALEALGALEAPLEPVRVGPFEPLEALHAAGRYTSLAGALVTLDEPSRTLLVHDAGPRRLHAMGVLTSALPGASRELLRLPSAGLPFMNAAASADGVGEAGAAVVRERVLRRLLVHALQ